MRCAAGALLCLALHAVEPVLAQDAASQLKQASAQNLLSDKPAPRSGDARLSAAFADKLATCYAQESKQPLTDRARYLLAQYAPELVLQLSAALKGTACDVTRPADDACLAQLAALPCAPLGAAIHAQGWDRAPSPAMEAAIAKYADRLVGRYLACRTGPEQDAEETAVRSEHMAKRSALTISLQITTGQCTLDEAQLQPCLEQIAAPDACAQLLQHAAASRLPRFCSDFVDCSAEPSLVGKIAK